MADMTGNTLEQRARELLAEACGADQSEIADALKFPNHPDNMVTVPDALRAIEAALRLSAGADASSSELLQEDIDGYHKAMDGLGFVPRTCDDGRDLSLFGRALFGMLRYASTQRALAIEEVISAARSVESSAPDPRAAAPRHEPGEVQP